MIRTRVCPRRLMRPAQPYLRAWSWREKGAMAYIYPDPARVPSDIIEGVGFIDTVMGARAEEALQKVTK